MGLYVDPPAHAVVLSVDEKSQIQALDRTQPGLPIKKVKAGTMTFDYKRNGTTTLFAAVEVLEGTVIGHCMQRHRHQEFIRFLNAIERAVPAGKLVHVVLDNYATHKHRKVSAQARSPSRASSSTCTPTSMLLTQMRQVKTLLLPADASPAQARACSTSIVDLQTAINRFIEDHNCRARSLRLDCRSRHYPRQGHPRDNVGVVH